MRHQMVVGLDIAKSVFQVDAVDADGVVLTKKLPRRKVLEWFAAVPVPALVGMEACATSHFWGREIGKLGHEVRLLPPSAVKPFVKRGKKNDAADAAAIREALGRPSIHPVPVKTEEQQGVLALHTVREEVVAERTACVNALRALFAEYGIVMARGRKNIPDLEASANRLPSRAAVAVGVLFSRIRACATHIERLEKELMEFHRQSANSRNLATIPSVGPITATLIVAKVGDATRFKRGRDMAAWLGLVPSQNSSGGKTRLGSVTKAGDRAIRRMLFLGALAVTWRARPGSWLGDLKARKPFKLAAIALANKTARIVWAVLIRGSGWREATPRAA